MTWASHPAYLWLGVEAELAVICASAPALKIYFKDSLGGSSATYTLRPSYVRKPSDDTDALGESLEKGIVTKTGKQGLWDVSVDDEHGDFS
jgi:hypothetical protein